MFGEKEMLAGKWMYSLDFGKLFIVSKVFRFFSSFVFVLVGDSACYSLG